MTIQEFIKIKINGTPAIFKDLIGLRESEDITFLKEFCAFMHPNIATVYKGHICHVYTKKSCFIYHLYKGCILKTNVETGSKTLYKY